MGDTASQTDSPQAATEQLYLDDAYLQQMEATVVAVSEDGASVALDRTVFYATGGGQPHDTGVLTVVGGTDRATSGAAFRVTDVAKRGQLLWHTVEPAEAADSAATWSVGDQVRGQLDWERRHQLMRTHTMLHVLGGVIWNRWEKLVTGGNMTPLTARMDFEFSPLPDGFREQVTEAVNAEIAANRPIEVTYLDRAASLVDPDLIRTKVNLIPESVSRVRVVDIVGLDKQADGGTHVASTGEIGRFEITKTESKGKGNKRLRLAVHDA